MFSIQIKGGTPISEQLEERIEELIVSGTIKDNEKLPTVREISKSLAINPNTVQKTYRRLESRGFIYSIPGKGSYVKERSGYMQDIKEEAKAAFAAAIVSAAKRGLDKQELLTLVQEAQI